MSKRTLAELQQRQALPLSIKVRMTAERIRNWVDEFGEDGVYVSFSGGKDSTVLLDIVRQDYPNVPAVFVDTGLEYPDIRDHVKKFNNVTWLRPKMNFKKVIQKYGYPFISKQVSETVYDAKRYLQACGRLDSSTVNFEELANVLNEKKGQMPSIRIALMFGMLTTDNQIKANIPRNERSTFSQERYKFLLDAPFDISSECCSVMKKAPVYKYERETGRKPMTAQMASESRLRMQKWLQNGCNAFNAKYPISNPMSFWTEQDVLWYIREKNIPIASVYGDIVSDDEESGQMNFADLGLLELDRPILHTTGCNRTGCMFCGYGCHLEKSPNRFERMKETHKKQYEYIMKPTSQGGLGYKDIIDWINEHGNMNIKY